MCCKRSTLSGSRLAIFIFSCSRAAVVRSPPIWRGWSGERRPISPGNYKNERAFNFGSRFFALLPSDSREDFSGFVQEVALQQMASFHRRVMELTQSWSCHTLWLAKVLPDVECLRRKDVAARLLTACVGELQLIVVKIRIIFYQELCICRDTGGVRSVCSQCSALWRALGKRILVPLKV